MLLGQHACFGVVAQLVKATSRARACPLLIYHLISLHCLLLRDISKEPFNNSLDGSGGPVGSSEGGTLVVASADHVALPLARVFQMRVHGLPEIVLLSWGSGSLL